MLFASGRGSCLALASSLPWRTGSAGYVGFSDGWQQLHNTGELDAAYQRAEDGNVALTGEIGFSAARTKALLALGFGATPEEVAEHAFASLKQGFEPAANSYLQNWRNWQKGLLPLDRHAVPGTNFYRVSTAVLATHRSIATPGAAVASLSIPWGFDKGDDDLGGYHLVWPRDLVETAGGFLAAGDAASALQILDYLGSIQQPDGHWPQNAWLDGSAYWPGIQMDECAFPLLLAEALHRAGHLPHARLAVFLPMIERAAGFVVRNGPVTGEDRWEEDAGYSPFTLAVEIAALLAAADLLDACGKPDAATYLRETSDVWNDQVERWTYVTGTAICGQVGVEGYYVRIAPPDSAEAGSPKDGYVPIKNRPPGDTNRPAEQIVSPDALALVRFGLRAADDPRMTDTVKVIDAQLRCDLPQGPLWYRYNGDGYGEHEDGAPFDGTGQGRPGRCWPANAPTMSWRPGVGKRQPACWQRWKARPDRAACCRSRSGTAPICRSANCCTAAPRAAPCRWSGRIRSISSCCARCATARSSTCRRKASSGISRPRQCRRSGHGGSTTRSARSRPARHCASNCWLRLQSIGAPTTGRPPTIARRWRTISASILPIWPSLAFPREAR